jgi:cytochrome c-type biogenesis protein CcmH/NrfF
VAFRVGNAAERGQSPAQVLDATLRDRYWKLVPSQPIASAPVLRWGYRAESLVFLAQGAPPFALAVGSARVTRPQAPLSTTLAAIREQRGRQWQPALATLQTPAQPLAGSAALQPLRDWKSVLLWGLLVAGALLVAGFAFSLLRRPPPAA